MAGIFKVKPLWSLLALLIWMTGCTSSEQPGVTPVISTPAQAFTQTPTFTQTLTLTPTISATIPVPVETSTLAAAQTTAVNPPELTFEMNLAINPPPPVGIKAVAVAGGIKLTWTNPPAVIVPHHYSDNILFYKIYRRTETIQFTVLAQTSENFYLDETVTKGIQYFYIVTAQHENGIESSRPDEISVTP